MPDPQLRGSSTCSIKVTCTMINLNSKVVRAVSGNRCATAPWGAAKKFFYKKKFIDV